MAALETRDLVSSRTVTPSAIVWIDGSHAMLATMSRNATVSTGEIVRGWLAEPSYLAQVVRAIGDRQRVVILGPGSARLALEREYVAIYQRPDRLVDVEPAGAVDPPDLVDRLRRLVA
jgi:hypothetical protein